MTKITIIKRYIWLKIISKEWGPGFEIPSANALALHLKQSASSIKTSLKTFTTNKMIICKNRGKCTINDDLYSIIPFSISRKYNARCLESQWVTNKDEYKLYKKYETKNSGYIKTKLTIYDKLISKEFLNKYSLFEVLAFLDSEPSYFSQKVIPWKEDDKYFIKIRTLVFNDESIIIAKYTRIVPIDIFQSRFITSF